MYRLVIGNKNYSSWSMRPWVLLRHFGIPFEEVRVAMFTPGFKEQILRHSPTGKVPCLLDGDLAIWDSLAIAEYLAERHPGLWPAAPAARAIARAVSAEMHSGFVALREECTMNIRRRVAPRTLSAAGQADVARITALWADCRARYGQGGPYLFGDFSIADAMFGPVAFRFQTYGLPVEGAAADYLAALLASPAMQTLAVEAAAEPEAIAHYDAA